MHKFFHRVASKVSNAVGSPLAFLLAFSIVVVWGLSGKSFGYSDTWQLVINTGTTIVTFLMVFLIQNTQNRDAKAVHLKLDELIRSSKSARNVFVDLEDLSDEELAQMAQDFSHLRERQAASESMKRLHQSIEAEHRRRQSPTARVLESIMQHNPLAHNHDDHKR